MPATAKAAPEPAPALSPDRARLARAIEQHDRARKRLEWLRAGDVELERRSREASTAIETAEAVVREAEKSAEGQPAYVALLLPGTPAEEDEAAAAAQRRLELAEKAFAAIQRAREVLRVDLASAQDDARRARAEVDRAVGEIVAASPHVTGLVADTEAAIAGLLSLIGAWQTLAVCGGLPQSSQGRWDTLQSLRNAVGQLWRADLPDVDTSRAEQFRQVVQALSVDAATEL